MVSSRSVKASKSMGRPSGSSAHVSHPKTVRGSIRGGASSRAGARVSEELTFDDDEEMEDEVGAQGTDGTVDSGQAGFYKNPNWEAKLAGGKRKKPRNVRQLVEASRARFSADPAYEAFNFGLIEAPPSSLPSLKFCDVTGLPVSLIVNCIP